MDIAIRTPPQARKLYSNIGNLNEDFDITFKRIFDRQF